MKPRASLLAITAGLSLALLSSCQQLTPVIVVNESNEPIDLLYTFELRVGKSDVPAVCRALAEPPRSVPVKVSSSGRTREHWKQVQPFEFDEATCTMSFRLPPGSSAILSLNGLCHVTEKNRAEHPDMLPRFNSLTFSSSDTRLELRDWAIARRFESRSSGACIYRWK